MTQSRSAARVQIKKIGWRQIGKVASTLWFVGFAWFLWPTTDETDLDNDYLRACTRQVDSDNDKLQFFPKELRESAQARNLANYEKCKSRARVLFSHQVARDEKYKKWLLSFDFLTIVFAWFLVWFIGGLIAIGRWTRRKFANMDDQAS
jgi:hypothetical protein